MSERTTAQFRQHLETLTAQARIDAGPEVASLVADLIDLLCGAYARGGLAESRRALYKVKAMIRQGDEAGGQQV